MIDAQAATIILASGSQARQSILRNAGIPFDAIKSDIDERVVEAAIGRAAVTPFEIATILAEAKATEVSLRYPQAIVIGADQTMALDDQLFHKPADMEAARRHLLALSGKTHELNSAVVLARSGLAIWRYVDTAHLTMRKLSPEFIGRHLSDVGDHALQSVGAYQIEGPGIQLFERIEGGYFTILGMPIISLLSALREQGAIDA